MYTCGIELAWLQEREYLKNYIGRIAAVEPDIVLVERTVSRVAQELILATGITLVTNVKPVSVTCMYMYLVNSTNRSVQH